MGTDIEKLVSRFICDITDIVRRVRHESRMATFRALGPLFPEQRPISRVPEEQRKKKQVSKSAPRKVARPSPTRRHASPLRSPVPSSSTAKATTATPRKRVSERKAAESVAPLAKSVRKRANTHTYARGQFELMESASSLQPWAAASAFVGTNGAAPASEPPLAEQQLPQNGPEREAAVLEAVRFLVRGTAGEIVERSGLPNNTVYLVLRSLVAAGRVAKGEAARGTEYSLVSMGSIRPFKRRSASRPESEAPPPPSSEGSEVQEAAMAAPASLEPAAPEASGGQIAAE